MNEHEVKIRVAPMMSIRENDLMVDFKEVDFSDLVIVSGKLTGIAMKIKPQAITPTGTLIIVRKGSSELKVHTCIEISSASSRRWK